MPKGKSRGGAMTSAIAVRAIYFLELARGCSHVSSMLTPDTCTRAITEVIGEFRNLYGDEEVALFKELLAEDLERRGKGDAALEVRDFVNATPAKVALAAHKADKTAVGMVEMKKYRHPHKP
ncbi:hypothetical protein [Paraburkholderia terricola]|uniref:hypothetical protein n=1 Tax=Paraburkholderia terricola TaxID=169427 RepID=UPI001FD370CD|nr:hypothetical protein [Paraburkholderia terricola]